MGLTLEPLAKRKLTGKPIFDKRFCVEICEKVHTHYRNFRIVQSLDDFINMAEGFASALERWKKRGCPGTGSRHIELCRKQVAVSDFSDDVEINLNKNLYLENEGQIFAEGADFKEDEYIHLKIRDVRIELSIEDFKALTETMVQAYGRLNKDTSSSIHVTLPSWGVYG